MPEVCHDRSHFTPLFHSTLNHIMNLLTFALIPEAPLSSFPTLHQFRLETAKNRLKNWNQSDSLFSYGYSQNLKTQASSHQNYYFSFRILKSKLISPCGNCVRLLSLILPYRDTSCSCYPVVHIIGTLSQSWSPIPLMIPYHLTHLMLQTLTSSHILQTVLHSSFPLSSRRYSPPLLPESNLRHQAPSHARC